MDGTLRGLLARFDDARYAPAARALFGLPPAEPGQNLTVRRELAAAQAGHEEQLTRLWSTIYGARAELLAVERLISLDADRVDIITTAVTAAWRWAAARAEAISYCTAFAPESETSPDELVALAGWTPALTPAQASRLTEGAASGASREQFTAALHGETGLGNPWVDGFLARSTAPEFTPDQENGSTL